MSSTVQKALPGRFQSNSAAKDDKLPLESRVFQYVRFTVATRASVSREPQQQKSTRAKPDWLYCRLGRAPLERGLSGGGPPGNESSAACRMDGRGCVPESRAPAYSALRMKTLLDCGWHSPSELRQVLSVLTGGRFSMKQKSEVPKRHKLTLAHMASDRIRMPASMEELKSRSACLKRGSMVSSGKRQGHRLLRVKGNLGDEHDLGPVAARKLTSLCSGAGLATGHERTLRVALRPGSQARGAHGDPRSGGQVSPR